MPQGLAAGLLQGYAKGKEIKRQRSMEDIKAEREKQAFELQKKQGDMALAKMKLAMKEAETRLATIESLNQQLGLGHERAMANREDKRDAITYVLQKFEQTNPQNFSKQAQPQPQMQQGTPMGESIQQQGGFLDKITEAQMIAMGLGGMAPTASLIQRMKADQRLGRQGDERIEVSRGQLAERKRMGDIAEANLELTRKKAYKPEIRTFMDKGVKKEIPIDPYTKQPVGGATTIEKKKGMPAETAAKLKLITKGQEDLRVARSLIVKNGKVDRKLILDMDTRMPFSEGRRTKGLVLAAVEGKLRAESGAAVPPEEVKRAAVRYMPTSLDSDKEIINKLRRLDEWLSETAQAMDPQELYHKKAQNQDVSNMSDEELLKALEAK